jgi:2-polyprenyl-6-methoxyphenol hydroxylase-like FAD-dependent oxidoreductase
MAVEQFDVIVVGASLAGCAAATLLARQGARVALLERHVQADAHKALCTHFIQASALPVLQRLGLDVLIEEAGGVRNGIEIHTPYGWIGDRVGEQPDGHPWHGYNIRRSRLDPMIRRLAASTRGVSLLSGLAARSVIEDKGRISGVVAHSAGADVRLSARLVVAADGRHSEVAARAGVPLRTSTNLRHSVVVPMSGVALQRASTSQSWMTGPEVLYAFPNDDGITVLAWVAPRHMLDRRPRAQMLDALRERFRSLPDAPGLLGAEQAGELLMVKDFPNQWRPPVFRGMALVGDAATSMDYLQGIGCGWALQSGAWLADAVVGGLHDQRLLDQGLKGYARQHQRTIGPHRFFINDFARRLDFNAFERLFYAAAAKDAAWARRMMRVGARLDSPLALLTPVALAQAAWLWLQHGPATEQGTRTAPGAVSDRDRLAA